MLIRARAAIENGFLPFPGGVVNFVGKEVNILDGQVGPPPVLGVGFDITAQAVQGIGLHVYFLGKTGVLGDFVHDMGGGAGFVPHHVKFRPGKAAVSVQRPPFRHAFGVHLFKAAVHQQVLAVIRRGRRTEKQKASQRDHREDGRANQKIPFERLIHERSLGTVVK